MKKTISISLLALLATFSSCKKNYTNFESYSTSYQTLNDTLKITVKASLGINQLNGKLVKLTLDKASQDVTGQLLGSLGNGQMVTINPREVIPQVTMENNKTISYKAPIKGANEAELTFYKLDGSIIKMSLIKSDQVLNSNY